MSGDQGFGCALPWGGLARRRRQRGTTHAADISLNGRITASKSLGRLCLVTDQRSTTVLIVDDDEDMRLLVKLKLELSGQIEVVAEAVDGIDALDSFVSLDPPPVPQVVVLDNRMPGMTGLEVAAHLLESVPTQRIILFSAYLDDATVAQARNLGITEVVSKNDVNNLPDIILRVHNADT